ncbi:hypothetical protein AB4P95_04350 [Pseudomonas sp. A1437]
MCRITFAPVITTRPISRRSTMN